MAQCTAPLPTPFRMYAALRCSPFCNLHADGQEWRLPGAHMTGTVPLAISLL